MSIQQDGFLSPDIDRWIVKIRSDHASIFNLTALINRLAQRQIAGAAGCRGDENRLLQSLCFVKALASFQSAILLIERGMVQDATIACRSCLETIFHLRALQLDPDHRHTVISNDRFSEQRMATGLMQLPENIHTQAKKDKLHAAKLEFAGQPKSNANIKETAKKAGLESEYNVLYRTWCHEASHVSITSLAVHTWIDENYDVKGKRLGPDQYGVCDTLKSICTLGVLLINFGKTLNPDGGLIEDYEECGRLAKSLFNGAGDA